MTREPIALAWSGGKDSAMALRAIRREEGYKVVTLLTTCTEGFRRVSVHGVRCSLLNRQVEELGLACRKVFIPQHCPNEVYERLMGEALENLKKSGVLKVAFGDLFLEDIRAYRDRTLAALGMTGLYPLWGEKTVELAREFIEAGFGATLVCVDSQRLSVEFAGRAFDKSLLAELPPGIDPCGENGEFHTFVHQGPLFGKPISYRPGRVVQRGQFHFADLLPGTTNKERIHAK
jgi:uncharacterized protein (TIGR00290 family)